MDDAVGLNNIVRKIGKALGRFLNQRGRADSISPPADPALLRQLLRPSDVLLIEGTSRVSTAIKYLTQSKTRPPTFFLSCSRPDALQAAYKRYLINGLRGEFGLAGVPIRLMVRRDKNPYEGKRKKR